MDASGNKVVKKDKQGRVIAGEYEQVEMLDENSGTYQTQKAGILGLTTAEVAAVKSTGFKKTLREKISQLLESSVTVDANGKTVSTLSDAEITKAEDLIAASFISGDLAHKDNFDLKKALADVRSTPDGKQKEAFEKANVARTIRTGTFVDKQTGARRDGEYGQTYEFTKNRLASELGTEGIRTLSPEVEQKAREDAAVAEKKAKEDADQEAAVQLDFNEVIARMNNTADEEGIDLTELSKNDTEFEKMLQQTIFEVFQKAGGAQPREEFIKNNLEAVRNEIKRRIEVESRGPGDIVDTLKSHTKGGGMIYTGRVEKDIQDALKYTKDLASVQGIDARKKKELEQIAEALSGATSKMPASGDHDAMEAFINSLANTISSIQQNNAFDPAAVAEVLSGLDEKIAQYKEATGATGDFTEEQMKDLISVDLKNSGGNSHTTQQAALRGNFDAAIAAVRQSRDTGAVKTGVFEEISKALQDLTDGALSRPQFNTQLDALAAKFKVAVASSGVQPTALNKLGEFESKLNEIVNLAKRGIKQESIEQQTTELENLITELEKSKLM